MRCAFIVWLNNGCNLQVNLFGSNTVGAVWCFSGLW